MADKLRVGVIGTGYVSKNNYLPVLAQTEDIEFVGVMAKNYENAVRAAKSFGAQHAVQTIEELVDLGLDCAFVLTPKAVHAEQVSFLMNHGLEIPYTHNVDWGKKNNWSSRVLLLEAQ